MTWRFSSEAPQDPPMKMLMIEIMPVDDASREPQSGHGRSG